MSDKATKLETQVIYWQEQAELATKLLGEAVIQRDAVTTQRDALRDAMVVQEHGETVANKARRLAHMLRNGGIPEDFVAEWTDRLEAIAENIDAALDGDGKGQG